MKCILVPPNVPIQINLNVNYKQYRSNDEPFSVDKLIWDNNKNDEFRQQIISEIATFHNIVDRVISSETNVNRAISDFADALYKTSFKTHGTSIQIGRVDNKRLESLKARGSPKNARLLDGSLNVPISYMLKTKRKLCAKHCCC